MRQITAIDLLMLNFFRTYQMPTRLIVLAICVMTVVPFVGHACMMGDALPVPAVNACCCEDTEAIHEMAHHAVHGHNTSDRHNQNSHSTECMDADTSRGVHHGVPLQGDCCAGNLQVNILDSVTRVYKDTIREHIATTLFALPVQGFQEPVHHAEVRHMDGAGPPRASTISLHKMYAHYLI